MMIVSCSQLRLCLPHAARTRIHRSVLLFSQPCLFSSHSSSSRGGRGRRRSSLPIILPRVLPTTTTTLPRPPATPLTISLSQREGDLMLRRFLEAPPPDRYYDHTDSEHLEVLPRTGGGSDVGGGGGGGGDGSSTGGGISSGDSGDGGSGSRGRNRRPPVVEEVEEDGEEEEAEEEDEEGSFEESLEAARRAGRVYARSQGSSPGSRGSRGAGGDGSGNGNSLVKVAVPNEYPQLLAVPLTRRPLFPGFYKSLFIRDPAAIAAIQSLVARRQPYIAVFLAHDDDSQLDAVKGLDEIHRVGVFAQITNVYAAQASDGNPTGGLNVVVYPHRRIRINGIVNPPESAITPPATEKASSSIATPVSESTPSDAAAAPAAPSEEQIRKLGYLPHNDHLSAYPVALVNVDNQYDQPYSSDNNMIKATTSEMLNVLKEISQANPLLRDQIITFSIQTGGNAFTDPARLADFAAAVSSGEPNELQSVLESLVIEERLFKSLVVLKKELANARLQQEIAKEVDRKISKKQQDYFLMEQLKGIKKQLGMENDGKDKLVEKFRERAKTLTMPDAVEKVFDEEINKLQNLEPAAAEFNVTRNYLDWITQIPWGKYSQENFDLDHAVTVLDEDHHGLKDVKDRILEFIAVGKLRGTVEGKIICLVGPPGVGKTSIGKSIARALGREFFRFSVGGLTDVAEIKGHRRTYVGAMPGKVIQALKKVQRENPLIMIDEIDKIGRGHQGDPASALLELLDPEQNSSFLDHYMDIPTDLSKVLFVCTANTTDTIPGPLLDRMEVIQLSGYVAEEKLAIAEKYLAPAARKDSGVGDDVAITPEALSVLIRSYCRESGVRNLKKHVDKVFRKAALKLVRGGAGGKPKDIVKEDADGKAEEVVAAASVEKVVVDEANLKDFVGPPVFMSDRMYESTPTGVVMGLAWTQLGGTALYIESVLESALTSDSKPSFHRTGQMGDVMKESSTIAYTYAKSFIARRFPENTFFNHASVHLHVPEGATPKDGPSAGTTMATALVSLALGRPVKANIAMTGELTVTGKVLKIGGVKEKTIAAKRSGVTLMILPESNRSDWEELADYIREGMQVRFVGWFDEIFENVF